MLGPDANYNVTSGGRHDAEGYLKCGYIHDYGSRGPDVARRNRAANRAFAEWQHNQQIAPDLSVTAEPQLVHRLRGPARLPLEGVRPGPGAGQLPRGRLPGRDFIGSVFTRFQPDSFYPVQQSLPEIRFDLLPTAIGGGFYVRLNSGIVHLEEDPPDGGSFP